MEDQCVNILMVFMKEGKMSAADTAAKVRRTRAGRRVIRALVSCIVAANNELEGIYIYIYIYVCVY